MLDPVKNFAKVQVSTGYDGDDTSVVLETDEGAKLPDPATDGAFNLVWWNWTDYRDPSDDPNREIVRCTARSGDTLTIVRPVVGNDYNGEDSDNTASTKNTAGKTYYMALTPTQKFRKDIDDQIETGWAKMKEAVTITNENALTIAGQDVTKKYGKGVKVKQVFTGGDNAKSLDLELSSSQFAKIVDGSQSGLDITGDHTIEAWIKLEQLPSSAGAAFEIVSKFETSNNNRSYRLFIASADNKPYIAFTSNGLGATETQIKGNREFSASDVGKWVHIAVSVDVSEPSAVFYIDGVNVRSTADTTTSTSIYNGAAAFCIGARESTLNTVYSNYFDGIISEVRVWNDIRTASEIRQNMFKNVAADAAGLVGYWKLDNDYLDETSNNNDLTAGGSPVFSTDVPERLVSGEMFLNVVAKAFSTNTTLTLSGGSDYYLQNATSTFYFSRQEYADGFPESFNFIPTKTYSGGTTDPTSNTLTEAKCSFNGNKAQVILLASVVRGSGDRTKFFYTGIVVANPTGGALACIETIVQSASTPRTCITFSANRIGVQLGTAPTRDGVIYIQGSYIF